MSDALASQVSRYGWYHSHSLPGGVSTQGMFDHRGHEHRYLIPEDLSGLRCLDVGTMDGFWAFEMERRGAAEVVAIDVDDPESLDWPASLRQAITKTLDETKAERFELVRSALDSSVQRVIRSVYELDTDLGHFDFVFCGDLLVHLKDPVTAVERIRRVCTGSAVVCNPIKNFFWARNKPIAQFDGIKEFEWWQTNLPGLKRLLLAAGFGRVEAGKPFALPATGGGAWRGLRGVVRGYV